MDNELAEVRMNLKEIESILIVLQQAIQNENEVITFSNIDDNLEIIIEKVQNTIQKFYAMENKKIKIENH